ncbi:MAG: hypothetical protein JSW27_07410 [Phycisphaerales bacterium]|nr:MAG: hypothetical protein JSW27_07410 [Phycisphaerales bacterium]
MRNRVFWMSVCLALAAGCATAPKPTPKDGFVNVADISMAEATAAAKAALSRMHFVVEKADPTEGVIRTRPLTGAQFFEFWRSDNAGPEQTAEASLHTLRRWVEIHVQPSDDQLRIDCTVRVQRLSLPANEITSVSQAYRMYSASTPTIQRLELRPEQQEGLAWIDLEDDPALADRILKRIIQRIPQPEEDETP